MFDDAKGFVKKCPLCQRFALTSNRPSTNLHTLHSLWHFMQWRLDIVRPLLRAQPQLRFLLVSTDYLTKWVETVPLSEVTRQQIVKFLWQNIVCRFGLSRTIVSDHGTNFASKHIATFCAKYKIAHLFSSLYYPQDNCWAKISNRTILDNMCKSLDKVKCKWVEKLPDVLWAYRTRNASRPAKPCSRWHTKQKRSSRSTLAGRYFEWKKWLKTRMMPYST